MQNLSQQGKSAFSLFLGYGLGVGAAFTLAYSYRNQLSQNIQRQKLNQSLEQFTPTQITGLQNQVYPWYSGEVSDWEYQLVNLKGYLKEERMFVRRSKDGKEGYLETEYRKINTANNPCEFGVVVNLGWVPLENQSEVTVESPLPLIEEVPGYQNYLDYDTSMQVYSESNNMVENDQVMLSELTGVIRKGEQGSYFRKNWPTEGNFNYIDLPFMTKFFRLFNLDSASVAYVERIVPNLDDHEEGLYPIPTSANKEAQN